MRDSGTASVVDRDRAQDLILELSGTKNKSTGCNSTGTGTAFGNDTQVNNHTNTEKKRPVR